MRHLIYLAVLAACLLGTAPLEVFLRVRVYARWKRLLLTLAPVVVVFVAWDVYAISRHHWSYDREQTTGIELPGHLPVEELLFFLVVPVCAVLTLEAVTKVRGRPREIGRSALTYTALAFTGIAFALLMDFAVLRTRLVTQRVFWISYAIIVVFQLITNGVLTYRNVVRYDSGTILGLRIAGAPVEDLMFGFSLVLQTLSWWVWWGRRVTGPDTP